MFRGKYGRPAADIDRYLPELRAYAKARCEPNKTGPAPFSSPGRSEAALKEPDQDSLTLPTGEIQKDPSLLDSPAMRRYYRSWEKQEAVTKTFSSEVMGTEAVRCRDLSIPGSLWAFLLLPSSSQLFYSTAV